MQRRVEAVSCCSLVLTVATFINLLPALFCSMHFFVYHQYVLFHCAMFPDGIKLFTCAG